MDATQFTTLLSHVDTLGTMIGGFILALIVATTWKG